MRGRRYTRRKTLRYVGIIDGLNYSSSGSKPRDYKGFTLFRQGRGQARAAREKNDTYQRRNILIYYFVFMIPIPIISTPRIY